MWLGSSQCERCRYRRDWFILVFFTNHNNLHACPSIILLLLPSTLNSLKPSMPASTMPLAADGTFSSGWPTCIVGRAQPWACQVKCNRSLVGCMNCLFVQCYCSLPEWWSDGYPFWAKDHTFFCSLNWLNYVYHVTLYVLRTVVGPKWRSCNYAGYR